MPKPRARVPRSSAPVPKSSAPVPKLRRRTGASSKRKSRNSRSNCAIRDPPTGAGR